MITLSYILGLILITGLSLVSFIFFLKRIDPWRMTSFENLIFLLSIFLSLSGLSTLIGTFIRRSRSQFRLSWKMIRPALRQGIIISSIATCLLILNIHYSLDWKIVMGVIIGGIFLETIFKIKERQNAKRT